MAADRLSLALPVPRPTEVTVGTTIRGAAIGLALSVGTGCASTSAERDLGRVRELSAVPLPSPAATLAHDLSSVAEMRTLLREPLTADAAVRIALLENRELRAAMQEVAASRGRAAQEGLLPNPAFQFDLRRSLSGDLPLQQDYFVEYQLTRALLAPARSRAAEAEVAAERFRAAAAAVALGARVRFAFYRYVAARQRLAVANRTLDALAAARDAARALRAAGNVPALDVALHEAEYEGERARAAEIELEALELREELNGLMGLHGELAAWTSVPELPEAEEAPEAADGLEAEAIEASLQLGETRHRLEALARRTGLARLEGWLPDVSVDAHVEEDEDRWEVGGGARLTLPLFDRQQGSLAASEAEFDGLLERYHATAVEIRAAARLAHRRLRSASLRALQYQRVIVPARARVVELTLQQYNAMQLGIFDVLRAQREKLDAELAQVAALRDYWTARAAVNALRAGLRFDPAGARGPAESAESPPGGEP
jgi:outer membrane protein TolC